MQANEVLDLLEKKSTGRNTWTAKCPAHEDKVDSLSVALSCEKLLIHCHAGCSYEEVCGALGINGIKRQSQYPYSQGSLSSYIPDFNADYVKNYQKSWKVWDESIPLKECKPVVEYLESRLIYSEAAICENLRAHPSLPLWESNGDEPELVGYFPAMVARVDSPGHGFTSVHRTYVNRYGEKITRKMMSPAGKGWLSSGRIELMKPTDTLVVGEGIETVLAFRVLSPVKHPVWSCISARQMAKAEIPEVMDLYILADNDKSEAGIKAAKDLAKFYSEIYTHSSVHILSTTEVGTDFADLLGAENDKA